MRVLRVALLAMALMILAVPACALSSLQFSSPILGSPVSSAISSPGAPDKIFTQPYVNPGEYVEYAYPSNMDPLITSGNFYDNVISNNVGDYSDHRLVGLIPASGFNGLQLQPSLGLIPSGMIAGSGLPVNQFSIGTNYASSKGPFGT